MRFELEDKWKWLNFAFSIERYKIILLACTKDGIDGKISIPMANAKKISAYVIGPLSISLIMYFWVLFCPY